MINTRSKLNKGFTIIESLVAITILVTVITGAMTAVQTGISSYTFSKNQIIANYLAQEGFEQLRYIRDTNALNNLPWLTSIAADADDPCYFGETCTVSPLETTEAIRCSAPGSCPVIREDPVNGFHGYNAAWAATPFRREIVLSSINGNEIAATVTIYWTKGSVTREFKVRENIFDWQ